MGLGPAAGGAHTRLRACCGLGHPRERPGARSQTSHPRAGPLTPAVLVGLSPGNGCPVRDVRVPETPARTSWRSLPLHTVSWACHSPPVSPAPLQRGNGHVYGVCEAQMLHDAHPELVHEAAEQAPGSGPAGQASTCVRNLPVAPPTLLTGRAGAPTLTAETGLHFPLLRARPSPHQRFLGPMTPPASTRSLSGARHRSPRPL